MPAQDCTSPDEARFIDLEIRLAEQEHSLDQLAEALLCERQRADRLERELARLNDRLRGLTALPLADADHDNAPPPHY